MRASLGSDLAWGIKRGVLLGLVFATVLGAAILIRGAGVYGNAPFLRIVAITASFGAFGGLCVGLLKPFARNYLGAIIVGSVGGIVGSAAVFIVIFGIDRSMLVPMLLSGIVFGIRAAVLVRRNPTNTLHA